MTNPNSGERPAPVPRDDASISIGQWPIEVILQKQRPITEWHWMTLAAAIGLFVGTALTRLIASTGHGDSPLYLLSSIAQSLAAVAALTITLPLAYNASSKYVPGSVRYIVRSPVMVTYVGIYALGIAISLVALRFEHPPTRLVDAALAISLSCLASIVGYIRWVSHAFEPASYLDEYLGPDYERLSRLLVSKAGRKTKVKAYADLRCVYGSVVAMTSEAAREGATTYVDYGIQFLISAAIDRDLATPTRQARAAWDYVLAYVRTHGRDAVAQVQLCQAMPLAFAVAYGGGRTPTEFTFNSALGVLRILAMDKCDNTTDIGIAATAIWTLGLIVLPTEATPHLSARAAAIVADVITARDAAVLPVVKVTSANWLNTTLDGQCAGLVIGMERFEAMVLKRGEAIG